MLCSPGFSFSLTCFPVNRFATIYPSTVTFAATPERALLNIKDDGVGIPADVLRRFESLGTSGVGLAGMRERIRELGVEFKVESRGGTSVQVTLPLTAPRSIAADVSGAH